MAPGGALFALGRAGETLAFATAAPAVLRAVVITAANTDRASWWIAWAAPVATSLRHDRRCRTFCSMSKTPSPVALNHRDVASHPLETHEQEALLKPLLETIWKSQAAAKAAEILPNCPSGVDASRCFGSRELAPLDQRRCEGGGLGGRSSGDTPHQPSHLKPAWLAVG